MAIPTGGEIAISNLHTSYNGPVDDANLESYYAGTVLVPSLSSGIGGALPTSGQISLEDFYGVAPPLLVNADETNPTSGRIGFISADTIAGVTATGSLSGDKFDVNGNNVRAIFMSLSSTPGDFVNTLTIILDGLLFDGAFANAEWPINGNFTNALVLNTDTGNPSSNPNVNTYTRTNTTDNLGADITRYEWGLSQDTLTTNWTTLSTIRPVYAD